MKPDVDLALTRFRCGIYRLSLSREREVHFNAFKSRPTKFKSSFSPSSRSCGVYAVSVTYAADANYEPDFNNATSVYIDPGPPAEGMWVTYWGGEPATLGGLTLETLAGSAINAGASNNDFRCQCDCQLQRQAAASNSH